MLSRQFLLSCPTIKFKYVFAIIIAIFPTHFIILNKVKFSQIIFKRYLHVWMEISVVEVA